MGSSLHSLRLLAVLVVTLGCGGDSNSTSPTTEGTFTGALSGDRTGNRTGFMNLMNTSTSLMLWGGTSGDDFDFDLKASSAGLPGIGVHQIGYGPNDFYSSVYLNDFEFEVEATSGTVTIATATATHVTGSFNITYSNSEESFTFAGTFSAKACTTACPE